MNSEVIDILKDIQARLEIIEKRLDNVETGCSKMSNHVNFVERVYTLVRRPLNFVIGTISLPPLIENKITEIDKE